MSSVADVICRRFDTFTKGFVVHYAIGIGFHSIAFLSNEFIASRCLDNLVSCYAGIEALLGSSHGKLSMVVLNDHEEVGSLSTTGADGPFLKVSSEDYVSLGLTAMRK